MRNGAHSLSQLAPVSGTTAESLAVSSTAVALTTAFDDKCTHVLISVGANAVRWRFDGSNPGSGLGGHLLAAGTILPPVTKAVALASKFIRVSSDSEVFASQLAP